MTFLVSIHVKDPIEISVFPSLILVATLLRLALNVAFLALLGLVPGMPHLTFLILAAAAGAVAVAGQAARTGFASVEPTAGRGTQPGRRGSSRIRGSSTTPAAPGR